MALIAIVGIGVLIFLNIMALKFIDSLIHLEHKRTRKEIQEVKTRLTQVRKDLNKLEKGRKRG